MAEFAQHVIETHDQVGDADIAAARDVGYTAAETRAIVTIAGVVPLTNYLDNVNDTIVEIPDAGAQAPRQRRPLDSPSFFHIPQPMGVDPLPLQGTS